MTGIKNRSEKGSLLVMTVIFSFVIILFGVSFLSFAVNLHNSISGDIRDTQATYDAYAGAFQAIADHIRGVRQYGWKDFYETNWFDYEIISIGHDDLPYGTEKSISIVGVGKSGYEGVETVKKVRVKFSYETFADYLYISHKERDALRNDVISFWRYDTLDGKVHSNDTIHIQSEYNTPLFKKRVTTTANYIYPPNNTARFMEGWGYRAPIIFPDQAEELRDVAGLWYRTGAPDSLTHIVLDGNRIRARRCGLAHIGGADSIACFPTTVAATVPEPHPASGVVFVEGKLWISASRGRGDQMDGPVPERHSPSEELFISEGFSGQLTICSSDTMIITDNLVYKNSRGDYSVPPTIDSCADVLGLVSERFIMVHRLVRDTVCINAAMASIRGSISVQDIYHYGIDNVKQSLFIWGSLAQRNRGIVHTTFQGERGFLEKDYHYDFRLAEFPPPYFLPTTEQKVLFVDDGQ